MSNVRDTNSFTNSSLYHLKNNSSFLKPKSNDTKQQSENAIPVIVNEQITLLTNKFPVKSEFKQIKKLNRETSSSLKELFYSIKGSIFMKIEKLSKNEVLNSNLMKFNSTDLYQKKLELFPIKLSKENFKSFENNCKFIFKLVLNRKRQNNSTILSEPSNKIVQKFSDLIKKEVTVVKDYDLNEIAKKEEISINNNYFENNNENLIKNGENLKSNKGINFKLEGKIESANILELQNDHNLEKSPIKV